MAKKNVKRTSTSKVSTETPNNATTSKATENGKKSEDVTIEKPSSSTTTPTDTMATRSSKRNRTVVPGSKSAEGPPEAKKPTIDSDWKGSSVISKADVEMEKNAIAVGPTRRSTRNQRTAETADTVERESSNDTSTSKKTTKKENRAGNSAAPPTKRMRSRKADVEVDPSTYRDLIAKLPPCRSGATADEEEREQVIWLLPSEEYFDNVENTEKVNGFIRGVVDTKGISIDRALYNLQQCDYNAEEAMNLIKGMKTCKTVPWTKEEADLFRRAFAAYGKNFPKIHEIISHKSIREIIFYYYSTKPYEQYKISARNIGPDEVDFGDSDDEGSARRVNCLICSKDRHLYNLSNGMVCKACKIYKNLMEDFDEDLSEYDYHDAPPVRTINCPDGMEDLIDDVMCKNDTDPVSFAEFERLKAEEMEKIKKRVAELSSGTNGDMNDIMAKKHSRHGFYFLNFGKPPTKCQTEGRQIKEGVLTSMKRCEKFETDIETEFANLQHNLKEVDILKAKHGETRAPRSRNTTEWSLDEKKLAISALVRYGTNFKAASGILRSKTPEMIEVFYKRHRNKLDSVINKHRETLNKEVDEVTSKFFTTL